MPYTHQDLSENHSYTLTQLLETHDLPKINKYFIQMQLQLQMLLL